MIVAIVGGSGFIGTCLSRRLQRNGSLDLCIVDKVGSKAYPAISHLADVRSLDALRAAVPTQAALVNLAAEHRDDVTPRSLYHEVNVQGARNICEVAREQDVTSIIFTSTVAVYGFAPVGTDESGQINPFNDYGRTKLEAEKVFRAWADADPARSLVIVRPSVVFGEGNRGNVYNLARQVASGRFLMVGDGTNRKSMTYVGNIVEYLADALNSPAGTHTSNYADKPDLSTRELIDVLRTTMELRGNRARLPLPVGMAAGHALDLVARFTRRTFPISAIRIHKFVSDTTVNTDRLTATGYTPRYSLSEGIRRTVEAEFPPAE